MTDICTCGAPRCATHREHLPCSVCEQERKLAKLRLLDRAEYARRTLAPLFRERAS